MAAVSFNLLKAVSCFAAAASKSATCLSTAALISSKSP